jgi:hypothetical protein
MHVLSVAEIPAVHWTEEMAQCQMNARRTDVHGVERDKSVWIILRFIPLVILIGEQDMVWTFPVLQESEHASQKIPLN